MLHTWNFRFSLLVTRGDTALASSALAYLGEMDRMTHSPLGRIETEMLDGELL